MTIALTLAGIGLVALSGIPALCLPRGSATGQRVAAALAVLGALSGMLGAILALTADAPESLRIAWPLPGGAMAFRVDDLSAFFLLQVFALGGLGAVYAVAYWPASEHPQDARKLTLFYGLMVAGIAIVVASEALVTLLFGWEIMALSAFLALTTQDDDPEVRSAGRVYLIATRASTLVLFALIAVLWEPLGGNFQGPPGLLDPATANAVFALALVGFGLKAGIVPLHFWLPVAHAAAPSHVSALMSGVLIKVGIYGLFRTVTLVADPPLWWGATLLALGVVSALVGVLFAIAQHHLKRLLAYHSVENIGIIAMGLGLALLGRSTGHPELTALGAAGALLHTWNHGIFKALLFLVAGAVLHATKTADLDHLGGLRRGMPRTAFCFLVGAVAISGLPPLNGFVSELLIFLGLAHGVIQGDGPLFVGCAFALPALALVGALAVACFVKVYGTVFLGEPRSDHPAHAHDPAWPMAVPMGALVVLCGFIGLGAVLLGPLLDRMAGGPVSSLAPLDWVSLMGGLLAAGVLGLWLFLAWRIRRGAAADPPPPEVGPIGTWDCGYAAPTARMQYTSSSFAQLLVDLFDWVLLPIRHRPRIQARFAAPATFDSQVPDLVLDRTVIPAAELLSRASAALRRLHQGRIHVYILYIVVTLVVLLAVYGGGK
jgi:hydrogenase-4 component B